MEADNKDCEAVRKSLPPTKQTELRSFVGLCNQYRGFFPSFARVAAPLNVRARKNQAFELEWNSFEPDAIHELKERLIFSPNLGLLHQEPGEALDTDACHYQTGCALMQHQPNGDKVHVRY